MNPLVTVIIPTYNRESFLREAIDSVLQQTERNFELIVVDDGSKDDTQRICAGHGTALRYLRQTHAGVSAARNHGIREARGDFVAFLDSDDLWQPDKLQRQIEWMDAHPEIPLCHTNEIWIRRGRRVNQKKIHQKYGGWIYPLCLPRCIISPSAVLIRRELFDTAGVFDEDLPLCEDYDLWLRITSRFEVGFIDEPLIVKRGGHADQLSNSQWGLDRYRITALAKMLEDGALKTEWRKQTLAIFRRKCQIIINGCRKRRKYSEARHYEDLVQDLSARNFSRFGTEWLTPPLVGI